LNGGNSLLGPGGEQSAGSRAFDQIRGGSSVIGRGGEQSAGSRAYDALRNNSLIGRGGEQSAGSRAYDALRNNTFVGPGGKQSIGSRVYDQFRAGGLRPLTPSYMHRTAINVRRGFHQYNYYNVNWYRRYPGAWYPAAWAFGNAWAACSWAYMNTWFGYENVQPIYYDYGNNVVYQDNSVYVNGQDVGTTTQYYQQAEDLASDGTKSDASKDGQWMPLGVFAMTRADQTNDDLILQLAVNKDGIIRGNYTNTISNQNQPVHGSVDKKTQRAAWTIGDNTDNVTETGIYNLTKDEVPILIHFGKDRTEQWMLVRLNQDDATKAESEKGF
jgi:hypothetical protein